MRNRGSYWERKKNHQIDTAARRKRNPSQFGQLQTNNASIIPHNFKAFSRNRPGWCQDLLLGCFSKNLVYPCKSLDKFGSFIYIHFFSFLNFHLLNRQLADVTKDGALSLEEFNVAMHLVVLRRYQIPLPDTLPASLMPALPPPKEDPPPSPGQVSVSSETMSNKQVILFFS